MNVLQIAVFAILFLLIVQPLAVAVILFNFLLVRTSRKKWARKCSAPKNREHAEMWEKSLAWREKNIGAMKEVCVENDGLKLQGEYFDFGFDKAAIIISGRAESCFYSLYFAEPYKNSGCNVLVIDNRAIGNSDGKYLCAGWKECRDIEAWANLLQEKFSIRKIILHGICVGAATGLLTATTAQNKDCFVGLVAEGIYPTFFELFKNQIIARRQFPFPTLQILALFMKIFSGVDIKNFGPIFSISKLEKPILFLHSKTDKFARPCDAQRIFDACASRKKIVWFDDAPHSHIRIRYETHYDDEVSQFVKSLEA